MPPLINTKTLLDISRHSSKVIRLSQLMDGIKAGYLVNQMAYLYDESDPMDVVLAFNKDLGTTANMVKDVSLIVESVDSQGRALELTSDENDLGVLFPEHWDNKTQTLELFNLKIRKSGSLSIAKSDDIKSALYNHVMGDTAKEFPYKAFKKHVTAMKTLEKTEKPSPESPFHEALSYANQLSSVQLWQPFYEAAISTTGSFREFRRSLNDKERQTVDEKIYSGRAMIDGVVKDSTYITIDGKVQIAASHKGNKNILNAIDKMVGELDFIRSVEIDKDTDIVKFHDMLVDISRMGLDFPDAFDLKSRKLGNYRACGISVTRDGLSEEYGFANADLRIVAVDVNYPTSLSHEITHFRDRESTPFREKMVNHFRSKINASALEEMYPGKTGYYLSGREVLARMGEIGFMLNQFGYKDDESMDEFKARVIVERESVVDEGKSRFNVSLSKNIEKYLGEEDPLSPYIYFDMANWQPEEVSMVRDFTHDFFYKHDPEIARQLKEKIDNGLLEATSLNYQKLRQSERPKRERRELTSTEILDKKFKQMQPNELLPTYKIGVDNGLFKDGEFFEAMNNSMLNMFGVAKETKSQVKISYDGLRTQLLGMRSLVDGIDVEARPGDALVAARLFSGYMVGSGIINPDKEPRFATLAASDKFILNAGELYSSMQKFAPDSEIQKPDVAHIAKLGNKYWRVSGTSTIVEEIKDIGQSFTRDLFERVFEDDTLIPKIDVKGEIPSTGAANWLKVTSLFHQEFNGYIPDEDTHDWQYDMIKHSRMNNLLNGNIGLEHLTKMANDSSWTTLINLPELKYHIAKSVEMQLVDKLISSDVFSELGLTKKDVFDFVVSNDHLPTIKANSESEIFKEWADSLLKSDAMHGEHLPKRELWNVGLYRREDVDSGKPLSPAPLTSFINMCMNKTKLGGNEATEVLASALTKAGISNSSLDKEIDDFITERTLDFNKARSSIISENGKSSASMKHPSIIALESQMFESDMSDFDAPNSVKATDMAKSIIKQSLLASYMRDAMSDNPNYIHAHIKSFKNDDMNWSRIKEGNSYDVEVLQGLDVTVEVLNRTLKGLPVLKMNSDPTSSYLQERSQDGRLALNEKVNKFLEEAVNIDPSATAMLLGGSSVLASPESPQALHNSHNRVASIDICQMSASLSTPLLEKGEYFGDMGPMVLDVVDRTKNEALTLLETPEHKIEDVPSNKNDETPPGLSVDEDELAAEQLEYFSKINEDVEVSKERSPFTERNQMKLF